MDPERLGQNPESDAQSLPEPEVQLEPSELPVGPPTEEQQRMVFEARTVPGYRESLTPEQLEELDRAEQSVATHADQLRRAHLREEGILPPTPQESDASTEAVGKGESEPEEEAQEPSAPNTLEKAREDLAKAESRLSALQERLADIKRNAQSALEGDDFKKASRLSKAAARLQVGIKRAEKTVREKQQYEAMIADALDAADIEGIEQQVRKELSAEKERRLRVHDDQPMDSYEDMLKRVHIAKYLKRMSDKYPDLPASVADDISAMIADRKQDQPSFVFNGDRRASTMLEAEENSEPTPEPRPSPTPENGGGGDIREEEKHFQPGQQVQFMLDGRMRQDGKVAGYSGRTKHGDPVAEVAYPGEFFEERLPVAQSLLENWQMAPADTSDERSFARREDDSERGGDNAEKPPVERGLKVWNTSDRQAYEVQEVKDKPNGSRVAVLEAFGPGGNEAGHMEVAVEALENRDKPNIVWKSSQVGVEEWQPEDGEVQRVVNKLRSAGTVMHLKQMLKDKLAAMDPSNLPSPQRLYNFKRDLVNEYIYFEVPENLKRRLPSYLVNTLVSAIDLDERELEEMQRHNQRVPIRYYGVSQSDLNTPEMVSGAGSAPESDKDRWWSQIISMPRRQEVEAARGGRGRIFGRLGRIGRRGARNSQEQPPDESGTIGG
ncbi:MAG TPA: hypothetical protein VHD84_01445 [Candidatus Saccharimonadales bacterium]|nr:hypothetical protein [Candidatus Saccharimonadales bacterium]